MKHLLYFTFSVFVLFVNTASAQYNSPENKAWRFGGGAGYDFNTNAAITSQLNAAECATSIADASGNLLFYTDGNSIWDRTNNLMPNGNPIFPASFGMNTQSTVQGALIVPMPGDTNKYYVFSLSATETPQNGGGKLYYSIVDKAANGGFGDVITATAHTLIDTGFSEHMIAVPTCGALWIVLHSRNSPAFKTYKIDVNGLNINPVISQTGVSGYSGPAVPGSQSFPGNNFYLVGQLAVSPDYKKLAASYFRGNCLELYSFDNNSGVVSANGIVDSTNDAYGFYGVSFSPDGNRLYAANCAASIAFKSFNQYNLALPTMPLIRFSRFFLGICNATLTQMQLGPDGKIYFNGNYISKLGTINSPNALGTSCGFNPQSVNLVNGTNVRGALHNTVMQSLKPADTFKTVWKDLRICKGEIVNIAARPGGSDYQWNDGLPGAAKTITVPGIYWVSYLINCTLYVDTVKVSNKIGSIDLGPDTLVCDAYQLYPRIDGIASSVIWSDGSTAPYYLFNHATSVSVEATISGCIYRDTVSVNLINMQANLGDDITICKGESISIPLSVSPPANTSVLWSTGATGNSITLNSPGTYEVVLSHPQCGTVKDEMTVFENMCDCGYLIPNAFTPNQDGKNDYFGIAAESGCPINRYVMRIYNRWGQMVFVSYNSSKKWDGTHNGKSAEVGVYFYQIQFEKGTSAKNVNEKGEFSLIR